MYSVPSHDTGIFGVCEHTSTTLSQPYILVLYITRLLTVLHGTALAGGILIKYVDMTERCTNARLRERANYLSSSGSLHLTLVHCCQCTPSPLSAFTKPA